MKTIIITGASEGLGKALAELCVENKMHVVNISRTPSGLKEVEDIACDLSNEQDITRTVQTIKDKYSNFNVLVNNAAIVALEKVNQITYKKFEKAWKVNSIAPLFLTSQLFDLIVKNEADVINIGTTASQANRQGFIDQLAYTATKYGLRGGSYNISLELAKTQSRLIHVNLGGMDTKMHEKDYGIIIENHDEWMKPHDIAQILMYLVNLPKQIEISEITINRKGRRSQK